MEEEKGGFIHIIFIFIGIALTALGTFYLFTDDKIDLNKRTNRDSKIVEEKEIIKQISIIKNVSTNITLYNGKEVELNYIYDEVDIRGKFTYDGRVAFSTNSEEVCEEFYLYGDSIVAYCSNYALSFDHLYIINSEGIATLFDIIKYNNNNFVPNNILLDGDKLIISGYNNILDDDIDLCDDEEKENNDILDNLELEVEFELEIENDNINFNFIKNNKTVKDFVENSCKTVDIEPIS